MGHTLLCVCPILVSISAGPRSPDQLLRGFHGGDDRRFLFISKGSGISDHHIITFAEAFDRKVFAKIYDLIFHIVRDETFAFAILYILIFVALVFLLRLAALAINLVLRLPVLFSVNTFGGALLGLLEGMMVVWLLIWLAPRLGIALPAENTYLLHFFMTVGPMGLLSSLS